jgi:hypothetical protein
VHVVIQRAQQLSHLESQDKWDLHSPIVCPLAGRVWPRNCVSCCHTSERPGGGRTSPPWNFSSSQSSSIRVSESHVMGVLESSSSLISSSSSCTSTIDDSWMMSVILWLSSLEGCDPARCLSCHLIISDEVAHSCVFSLEPPSRRYSQSTRFRYACRICLVGDGIRLVMGTWACLVWEPSPACHMTLCNGSFGTPGNHVMVLWPACHKIGPNFLSTSSPFHRSSHWCLGRSSHGGSSLLTDLPMMPSRCRLSIRKCLVAVVYEIPGVGFGSLYFQD